MRIRVREERSKTMKWLGAVLMWSILASQVLAEETAANPVEQTPTATIPLGCGFRADDMMLSPDRKASEQTNQ